MNKFKKGNSGQLIFCQLLVHYSIKTKLGMQKLIIKIHNQKHTMRATKIILVIAGFLAASIYSSENLELLQDNNDKRFLGKFNKPLQ
jgi:hypothetical protein